MKKIPELIEEIISPDAIEHKVKFYDYHRQKMDSFFWENVYELIGDYIAKESKAQRNGIMEPVASPWMHRNAMRHADGTVNVGQYMDADLLAIKTTYECIKELKGELMRGHGEMTYDCEFRDTDTFSHWFLRELYDDVFHSGEWVLQENFCEFNKWCWQKGKRIYGRLKIYRLLHLDGTEMIFELPETKDNNLHCIMFSMLPEHQGNYFLMLKRFKFLFKVLCVNRNMRALQSPCLGEDMPECPVKKKSNGNDWRFEERNLGGNNCDAYALLLMWLRVGAVRPQLENDNKDNLFFFHPSKALEVKELMQKELGLKVFQHLGKGIYGAELTRELKSYI